MYFFTEIDKIADQSSGAFGAIDSNTYRVTSKHSTSETSIKAFAVDSGQLRFQQDATNSDLLNCILLPSDSSKYNGIPIAYFIYRGIKKASLLSDGELLALTGNNSHIINILREDKDNVNEIIDEKSLGLTLNTANGFLDINPLFSLFTKATEFNPIYVTEGTILGDLNPSSFGFEIVLSGVGFEPSLDIVRNVSSQDHIIDMANVSSDPLPKQRMYREQITNYLDPASFWTVFNKVNTNTGIIKGAGIYNSITKKYENANRVYLDIRNENGFSWNFYQNNSSDIKISTNTTGSISYSNKPYNTASWPILTLEASDFDISNEKKLTPLRIQFPIDPTTHLLFLQYATVRRGTKLRGKLRNPENKERFIELEEVNEYSKNEVELTLLNVEKSGDYAPVSSYLRVFIQKADYNAPSETPSPYVGTHNYLDNLFEIKPINQYPLKETKESTVSSPTAQLKIMDFAKERAYKTVAHSGVALDFKNKPNPEQQRIIFYACSYDIKKSVSGVSGKQSFYKTYYAENFGEPKIIKDILSMGLNPELEIPSLRFINNYNSNKRNRPKTLFAITLTVAEYNEILDNLNEFNADSHPVFFQIATFKLDKDVKGKVFTEITLRLVGQDSGGNRKKSEPLNLIFRSTNSQLFATPAAASLEESSAVIDTVDFIIDHDVESSEYADIRKALAILAEHDADDIYSLAEEAIVEGIDSYTHDIGIYDEFYNYYFKLKGTEEKKRKCKIRILITDKDSAGNNIEWKEFSGHTDINLLNKNFVFGLKNREVSSVMPIYNKKIANIEDYIALDSNSSKSPIDIANEFNPKLILEHVYNPNTKKPDTYSPPSGAYKESDFDENFVFSVKQTPDEAEAGRGLRNSGMAAIDPEIFIRINPAKLQSYKNENMIVNIPINQGSGVIHEVIESISGINYYEYMLARIIIHEIGHALFNFKNAIEDFAWSILEKQVKKGEKLLNNQYSLHNHIFNLTGSGHLRGNPSGNKACSAEMVFLNKIQSFFEENHRKEVNNKYKDVLYSKLQIGDIYLTVSNVNYCGGNLG